MNRRLEVVLTSWQRRRLQQLRAHPPSPRTGRWAICLLLSADGASSAAIAAATGFSIRAIGCIRSRWQRRGMAALRHARGAGRKPLVTPAYRQELRTALGEGPMRYGYAFSVWSIARLNAHLEKITGLRVCDEWLRTLVKDEGFVYRRPKHTLRGKRNERAFRKARRALDRLKKGLCSPAQPTSCGTRTSRSSTFTLT
jgi:transposase